MLYIGRMGVGQQNRPRTVVLRGGGGAGGGGR